MKRLFIFLSVIIGVCHMSCAQADGDGFYSGTGSSYENRDLGVSISATVGFSGLTDDMKDYFDALATAELDIACRFKKAVMGFRLGTNGGWTNQELRRKNYTESWPEDYRMRLSSLSLFAGYMLCDSKRFRISPNLSCGINDVIGVGDFDDGEERSNPRSATFTWGPGCALDIKLLRLSARIGESVAIRFNYQYNFCYYDRKYVNAKGDIQSYTIGLNMTF